MRAAARMPHVLIGENECRPPTLQCHPGRPALALPVELPRQRVPALNRMHITLQL
jgi:hypothetical protein